MPTTLPDWLITTLAAPSPHAACKNLLFHGTIERFEGPLLASQWEHLRWTSSDPAVAQAYCPETGALTGWTPAASWELDKCMLPDSDINRIIFRELGFDELDLEAETDPLGRIQSWRVLPNHPTWRDANEFILAHGYDISSGFSWIKTERSGNLDRILSADHKEKGRLFILERPSDLRILPYAKTTDGGLTGQQWMHTDVFAATAASGEWDGIAIDDVHQSPKLGHFSHGSIGLFAATLARLRYHVIDIVNFDPWDSWQHRDGRTTPEFDALWTAYQPARSLAA